MSSKRARRGLSVRWRLTLTYTTAAVATAAVLLIGVYSLVSTEHVAFVSEPGSGPDPPVYPELPNPEEEAIRDSASAAVEETLDDLRLFSGLGLLLMTGVSVAVGWAFAGRALRPVHTITSRARQISAASLDERLRIQGPHDELREMAETFDSLLDRIQSAFESERRLVATMSHELRTPLANQRAALDVALADPSADADTLRQAGEVALGQTGRAQRTVDALLTLARVQAGVDSPRLDPVALDQVTRAAVEAARDQGELLGLSWEVSLDPATAPGDAELLARAVGNLLQNAVFHNAPDGWVRVRVLATVGSAIIEVANSGPVLDAATVNDLTLPFRRGTGDRTSSARGTGLGLTIVRAVAEHHHAELRLTALEAGGLQARLTLPLTA
ncbi:sensor histidine kinase [Jiangella asiatica]|uniref:histidine kinase n=1 Tax=Jiangella asiatica TaxID=2530372 RepID=A0A4R5DFB2_9ACTN|nr:ATP-binding protein [Jiangella asiatica]TDE12642.1 HAMP domain-containing protein [Jiangella asiatica]